jgi:hypothetical protein
MEAGTNPQQRQAVFAPMDSNPRLAKLFDGMVEGTQTAILESKSDAALANADATLPPTKTAPTITIEQMKAELRAADCLYDKAESWNQLGAERVPPIPDAVIQEAYEKGGRVILRCSSISEKAEAVRAAGRRVDIYGDLDKQAHYTARVSTPEWIVVESYLEGETINSVRTKGFPSDSVGLNPEDGFAEIAYATIDGGRPPRGFENLYAFTTGVPSAVGSFDDSIQVIRYDAYVAYARSLFGIARFGPPRNLHV